MTKTFKVTTHIKPRGDNKTPIKFNDTVFSRSGKAREAIMTFSNRIIMNGYYDEANGHWYPPHRIEYTHVKEDDSEGRTS